MQRNRIRLGSAILALALATAGCAKTSGSSESGGDPAARLIEVEGSDLPQVVTTDRAESRIGLRTADAGSTIPYAALIYAADGSTYVYTRTKPHTYRRTKVEVADIDGDQVRLRSGPDSGEQVVAVGSAELFGVEQGIGG